MTEMGGCAIQVVEESGGCMRALFDDEGFSTIGAAIALLLSLALVFSLGGVYRISSDAAAIQDAADAAALAAMNEVAEYMVAVRVCDAVVLTMSLTGLAMYGAGVAALCVPASAPVGVKLIGMADKVLDARDSFSRQANRALLEAARALPFLAAVNAASVASANGQRWGGNVVALALLVPSEVKESTFLQDAAELKEKEDEAARAIQDDAARIQDLSEEAERVSQEVLAAKTRAFEHDCGRDPSYCMSERAAHLAGLRSVDNPRFSSVDAWSFTVALERAKSYYAARLASEAPLDSSVEEGARSALRRAFYEYALEELEFAYVHEDAEEFDAFFPLMPANTAEMRATALYSDAVYPVTVDALSGSSTMHAWDGCPRATSVVAYGSLETLERGGFVVCADCGFTAASLGKVASATSSVETGFEFHYDKVARSAQEYEIARQAAEESSKAVRASVQNVFDALADALRLAARQRISIVPPGSQGVIVLAVDFSEGSSRGYRVPFVQWSGTLGPRAAVSAATLLEEESQEGRTLVSSLLDGLAPTGGALVGAGAAMTDCWSRLLEAYGE
ncbi:MAG: molybdenum cofactor biosynthesis enzyme, partial [Eggerthellaceae bacterium]|nr:molybdenum cofactor biosynthesis enzyme [Eggerthellaceae bacterium]